MIDGTASETQQVEEGAIVRLALVDPDPIFRLGLAVALPGAGDLTVVEEADRLSRLSEEGEAVDVLVVAAEAIELKSMQAWRDRHPDVPIVALVSRLNPFDRVTAPQWGIRGCVRKGIDIDELVVALRRVAAGGFYWDDRLLLEEDTEETIAILPPVSAVPKSRSLAIIQTELDRVNQELELPILSVFDRFILLGRQRELRAARWLAERLLSPWNREPQIPPRSQGISRPRVARNPGSIVSNSTEFVETKAVQTELFEATLNKLQSNLTNLTEVPLEIDILKTEKKRELLYLIFRTFEDILSELRSSQIERSRLGELVPRVLEDLWQDSTIEFFGKYYILPYGDRQIELVDLLLENAEIVWLEILAKIPLSVELIDHLLFQTPLSVDGLAGKFGSDLATRRAELILQHIAIRVACGVIQPLLDNFADVEAIKQNFYARNLLPTREIERFRNELSWHYRWKKYIGDPKNIYESRFSLFVLNPYGIEQTYIYAPRREELEQLSGIQQTVTLVLEGRDAIAPRLRAVVALAGRSLVYVLTRVIGRGLGLVGRGILESLNHLQAPERSEKERR